MDNRLQVGIDFCQKRADLCLLLPDGRPLESHLAFDNSYVGYSQAKQLLLDALDDYAFDGIDVSGEATGYLWLPFFLHWAADPELQLHDLREAAFQRGGREGDAVLVVLDFLRDADSAGL